MTVDYKSIGERIKANRKQRQMTQAELAERTGMSDVYISRIETGVRSPSLGSLMKISLVLSLSLDSLVFEDTPSRLPRIYRDFAELLADCDIKERGKIELGYDRLSEELGFFEAKERSSVKKLEYYMNNPNAYNFIIEAFYQTPDELEPELNEKYGRIMADREKELRRMFEKVTLREGIDREQAFRLVMLVLDSFDDKYLSGISEQDSFGEEKLRDFINRRNEFLSMVRFGIEEK